MKSKAVSEASCIQSAVIQVQGKGRKIGAMFDQLGEVGFHRCRSYV